MSFRAFSNFLACMDVVWAVVIFLAAFLLKKVLNISSHPFSLKFVEKLNYFMCFLEITIFRIIYSLAYKAYFPV